MLMTEAILSNAQTAGARDPKHGGKTQCADAVYPPGDPAQVVLLPDAGPLITLAYANALDLLIRPQWSVQLSTWCCTKSPPQPDSSSARIAEWAARNHVPTRVFQQYSDAKADAKGQLRKANLGELAIQECIRTSSP
ncbi:MAG: hypothetical protein IPO43_18620 [Rhodoferax sp.]|nr:hypothetical protein [Rhodoferax sp.]